MTANAFADKVITKDGKVYTGKILVDTDKAVLIGNPPFDPNSTLIKAEDIQTIVYEQYKQVPPTERRRGLSLSLMGTGNTYSSAELSMHPAGGLAVDGGFRFHPFIELGAGIQWVPRLTASGNDFTVSNSTASDSPSRSYHTFWQYALDVTGKFYPFYSFKKWKTEPYVLAGYGWTHLIPNASGDSLEGAGWLLGAGAVRPITTHLFIDGRFVYYHYGYDTVSFLGQDGTFSPEVAAHQYSVQLGLSYRI